MWKAAKLLACGLLCGWILSGADFNGIWMGQVERRNGEMEDIAFQLTQKGATVGGKLYGDYVSTPITEGTIHGDLITFIVVAAEQAGNQINQTRLRFTGKMRDGGIELTREREGSTNAGNGGVVQYKVNSRQTFRLRRLL